MDAKEFLYEYESMCETHPCCGDCPMQKLKEKYDKRFCREVMTKYPDEVIAIVTAYSNRKTRQSEYIKVIQVPDSSYFKGVLDICPSHARGFSGCGVTDKTCVDCKRDFWLEEIN